MTCFHVISLHFSERKKKINLLVFISTWLGRFIESCQMLVGRKMSGSEWQRLYDVVKVKFTLGVFNKFIKQSCDIVLWSEFISQVNDVLITGFNLHRKKCRWGWFLLEISQTDFQNKNIFQFHFPNHLFKAFLVDASIYPYGFSCVHHLIYNGSTYNDV